MENQLGLCSTSRKWGKTKKKTNDSPTGELYIPDELIIRILCWLPAKDVLRFQRVCKKWRDFTSTREFTDLHMRCSIPMFLKGLSRVVLVDRCWEPAEKRTKIHKAYQPSHKSSIRFSHNGLVIEIGNEENIIFYNPIFPDKVSIIPRGERSFNAPFGIFFHPVLKEYCSLWRETISYYAPLIVQYWILNMESNPIWRAIRNPCTPNNRIYEISPVLIDTFLYWMVEPSEYYKIEWDFNGNTYSCGIMRFDIIKEEFRMIPCPVTVFVYRQTYNVNLVDIGGGRVSVVEVVPKRMLSRINIWTFNDDWNHLSGHSTYIINSDVYPRIGMPIPVAFRNGELAIQSDGRLFICNLKLGTYRNVGSRNYYKPHSVSLVSLKNWKSITNQHDDEIQTPNQL